MIHCGSKRLYVLFIALALTLPSAWCQNDTTTAGSAAMPANQQQPTPSQPAPPEQQPTPSQPAPPEQQPTQLQAASQSFLDASKQLWRDAAEQAHRIKETLQRWNYELEQRKKNATRKREYREKQKEAAKAAAEAAQDNQ